MKSLRATSGLILAVTLVGVSLASGNTDSSPHLLKGSILSADAKGRWVPCEAPQAGQWIRSTQANTVVSCDGVTLRADKGAEVRFEPKDNQVSRVSARGGRVYVSLEDQLQCDVAIGDKHVAAQGGEFLVDATNARLAVLDGSASIVKAVPVFSPLPVWQKSELALDGPDVRRRAKNRRRFTQGEENKGKRIGEDAPPTQTPPPSMTQTPAYTPTLTPTPSPSTPPSPPPSNPPTVVEGGFDPLPLVSGLLGAGGIAFLVIRNDGGNNDPQRIVFPASP